jgi:integrase
VARTSPTLTAKAVQGLKSPGLHSVGGAPGLRLQVTETGRSWILRIKTGQTPAGKAIRQEIGLGSYSDVSLAAARERALAMIQEIKAGKNPVHERKLQKTTLQAKRETAVTFRKAAIAYIDAMSPSWKSRIHSKQWSSTLETYAFPKLGDLPIEDIDTDQILSVLEPIWNSITETATRVRGRIESILSWAIAKKLRPGPNPAVWGGLLENLLPDPAKLKNVENQPALPYSQMPRFMQDLINRDADAAKMLRFVIYTAARSSEVRNMTWKEINLDDKCWIVPAARMKAKREHRVPLSSKAMAILLETNLHDRHGLVFPNENGRAFSANAMINLLDRMQIASVARGEGEYLDSKTGKQIKPHGFRSTFRDWVSEITEYESELAEMALAHAIKDKTEAAYRRGILLNKRVEMMEAWAQFCGS